LLQKCVAGGVLCHVAAIDLDIAAGPQRRADRGKVRLVMRDAGGIELGRAEREQAVGAVRHQVDGGETLDVVAAQVLGNLLHAVLVGIEDDRLHARRNAVGEELRISNVALDEDDLAWRRGGRRGRARTAKYLHRRPADRAEHPARVVRCTLAGRKRGDIAPIALVGHRSSPPSLQVPRPRCRRAHRQPRARPPTIRPSIRLFTQKSRMIGRHRLNSRLLVLQP
jgi:hypothetical protein